VHPDFFYRDKANNGTAVADEIRNIHFLNKTMDLSLLYGVNISFSILKKTTEFLSNT